MSPRINEPIPGGYETKPQVARKLQVTVRTIDQWMRDGRLPFFRINRTVRFSPEDVAEFLIRTSRVVARQQEAEAAERAARANRTHVDVEFELTNSTQSPVNS